MYTYLYVLDYYKPLNIIISSKCNLFSPKYGWKQIAHLALINSYSPTPIVIEK